MSAVPAKSLQLRSLITADGRLELSLAVIATPTPADHEVLVRVEAAPINPSDLGLLLGPADFSQAKERGEGLERIVEAPIPPALMRGVAGRVGQSLPVGNEGAGVVVAAGASPEAQALMGKTVAMLGGGAYSQHRAVRAADCLALPADATPAEGASCFVNPLTALGMTETMRREGHVALVHTAAASNLGRMLNKICLSDGIPLVNVVRNADQAGLLRGLGAAYVCDSSAPGFQGALTDAVAETKATLAFDAVGGGRLASQILAAMEAAAAQTAAAYSRYGSSVHKQVYIYGGLDTGPTELHRSYGMAWGVGGWLLTPFLAKIGPNEVKRLQARVAAELKTTFASGYAQEVSLVQALQLETIAAYGRKATGRKFLINPNKDLAA